jgi:L-methionine (R)-S-oxide reductase
MNGPVNELIRHVADLADHPDAGGALQRICDYLRREVYHYDWVGYYLAVPNEKLLVLGPFSGAPTRHMRIPYGKGICGQAAERDAVFVVPDVTSQSNYLACSFRTKAEIVMPIHHEGVFVGELDIDSQTLDPFTSRDDELLEAVCGITAPLAASIMSEAREA